MVRQPYDVLIDKETRERAYQYWEERGRPIGSAEIDWHRAVFEVNREHEQHSLWGPDEKIQR